MIIKRAPEKIKSNAYCLNCNGWGVVYKAIPSPYSSLRAHDAVREICTNCQKTGTTPIPLSEIL